MEQEFNVTLFEKKLQSLKDSQESINSLSAWCLENRQHHKKIVQAWLNVLKRVKVEHRLTLFYLANDVIQYSKRKNYEFVESWGTTLQKATTMVREEKVKHRVLRIFKIWEQRGIYGEEFLSDLSGLISVAPAKKSELEPSEFQPSYLISKIRACTRLEEDTDLKLKKIKENELKCMHWEDPDAVVASLKDRRRVEDVEKEVEDNQLLVEVVISALNAEIKSRRHLTNLLTQADNFYRTQRTEVKIVSNAYKNFSLRVKNLKKRLDEMLQDENRWSSPIPSPDVNAPSPSPDSDIELPGQDNSANLNHSSSFDIEQSYSANFYNQVTDQSSTFTNNGFSSFMGSNIPFDIHANLFSDSNTASHVSDTPASSNNLIEVIGNQKMSPSPAAVQPQQNSFSLNSIIKQLLPTQPSAEVTPTTPDPNIPYTSQPPLLPPPLPPFTSPSNNYNSNVPIYSDPSPYPDVVNTYANPPNPNYQPVPPAAYIPPQSEQQQYRPTDDYNPEEELETWENDGAWPEPPDMETPESPPGYEKEAITEPRVEYHDAPNSHPLMPSQEDVDHRVLLPPPHLPPHLADIKGPDTDHRIGRSSNKDIDHRNLISLTGSPGPETNTALPAPPLPPNLWQVDQDYRVQQRDRDYRNPNGPPQQSPMMQHFVNLASDPPPPPPLPVVKQNSNKRQHSVRREMPGIQDNVESIDMDLSDDEQKRSSPKDRMFAHSDMDGNLRNKRPLIGDSPFEPSIYTNQRKRQNNSNNIPIVVDNNTNALESPPIPPCLEDDVDAAASNILDTIAQDDFLEGLPEMGNDSDKKQNHMNNNNGSRNWYNNEWSAPDGPPGQFHSGRAPPPPPPPPGMLGPPGGHPPHNFQRPPIMPGGPPMPIMQNNFHGGIMGHFPPPPGGPGRIDHFTGVPLEVGMPPFHEQNHFRGRGGGNRGNWNNRGGMNRGGKNNRGFMRGQMRGNFRGGRGGRGFREQW